MGMTSRDIYLRNTISGSKKGIVVATKATTFFQRMGKKRKLHGEIGTGTGFQRAKSLKETI